MAQLDYFKLVKMFPEIIDVDAPVDVKIMMIEHIRKQTFKKSGIHALLPLDREMIHVLRLEKYTYNIKYRKETLFKIRKFEFHRSIPKFYIFDNKFYNSYFMSKEEALSIKRTILIDQMI